MKLFNVKEVADQLGIPPVKIYQWLKSKAINQPKQTRNTGKKLSYLFDEFEIEEIKVIMQDSIKDQHQKRAAKLIDKTPVGFFLTADQQAKIANLTRDLEAITRELAFIRR